MSFFFSTKRLLPLLCVLLLCRAAAAQTPLIQTLSAPTFGNSVRVLPTTDRGWVLFSLDSLKLAKFSSCGRNEWRKVYRFPNLAYVPGLCDIIATHDGGFAFMTRAVVGSTYGTLIVRLDAAGEVLWSNTYSDASQEHYPYTLRQDARGDFVLYGNVAYINQGVTANFLCRLTSTGALQWTRFYDLGVIWGGVLLTSDGGMLARTGGRFIKTNSAGDVQWTSEILSPDDRAYFPPIEVRDGYIAMAANSGSLTNIFFKFDKQGNLLWNSSRKRTEFYGFPAGLRLTPSGNFIGVFNKWVDDDEYAAVLEFDPDLTLIRQRALTGVPDSLDFSAGDACFTTEGHVVMTGLASFTIPGLRYIAKADSTLRTACDTALTELPISTEPITQRFLTVNSTAATFTVTPRVVDTHATFPLTMAPVCAPEMALRLLPDTTLCPGATLTLRNQSGSEFERYRWSTGATTAAITVAQPGTYTLQAIYNCGRDTLRDAITVAVAALPAPAPAADTILCTQTPTVRLDARVPGAVTYRWQDGSTLPELVATDTGQYVVEITNAHCTRRVTYHVSECELLIMPNVFTANGDAVNDRFVPIEMRGIASATLEIFNRWGRKLYTSADIRNQGWDGTAAGRECADGVYFWLVRYTTYQRQQKMVKGYVELLTK